MAKKTTRTTPADPERTPPLQAYFAALQHRQPDPAYTAFTAQLGPERTVEFNDAVTEQLRGRLDLMARRLARHEEGQRMLAIHGQTHGQTHARMGRPPESTAWIDAHLQERYPASDEAVAEQHLARLADRIDRLPLEAEAAYGRDFKHGRKRDAVGAMTRWLRTQWTTHRADNEPTRFAIAAYLARFTPEALAEHPIEHAPHAFWILRIVERMHVLHPGRPPVRDAEIEWHPAGDDEPKFVWASTLSRRLKAGRRRRSSS